MTSLIVEFLLLDPRATPPQQQREGDSGWDLQALETCVVPARGRHLVRTGLALAIPVGWEGQVRPRSGLALKRGLTVLNSPGTIDSGYRGEVGVLLFNTTDEPQTIAAGERIAQLVFAPVASQISWSQVPELPLSERGEGGFGHTGSGSV